MQLDAGQCRSSLPAGVVEKLPDLVRSLVVISGIDTLTPLYRHRSIFRHCGEKLVELGI